MPISPSYPCIVPNKESRLYSGPSPNPCKKQPVSSWPARFPDKAISLNTSKIQPIPLIESSYFACSVWDTPSLHNIYAQKAPTQQSMQHVHPQHRRYPLHMTGYRIKERNASSLLPRMMHTNQAVNSFGINISGESEYAFIRYCFRGGYA